MTKTEAKKLAEKVSVSDLKYMFVNAYAKISNWERPSRVNKAMTIGTTFNVLSKCGVDSNTHILAKINMLREFGEYLPDYQEPAKKTKKNSSLHHQKPNPLNQSFYEL